MKLDIISKENLNYKIIIVTDEISIIDALKVYFNNYDIIGFTNPIDAIERVRNEHFDLMLLDYIMPPFRGDQVVEDIRKFNKDLYILLLTCANDPAPPLETVKKLDIQGYCEKTDNFEQLLLLIKFAMNSVDQMKMIKKINHEFIESKELLEKSYLESIEALRSTVEVKDIYTKGHSDRVAEYALLIGKKLNLSSDELNNLKIGALFHDIGKIGIPDSILLKNSKLTEEEYSEIKKHPLIGEHILSNASIFSAVIPIVKYHHERYDGTGYPSHLSENNIPILARIVSIADAFDAITSPRAYRGALDLEYAKNEIEKYSGSQFDPAISKIFIDILTNEPDKVLEIQSKY